MKSVSFEFEKYKLIDVIFVTLQAALQKVGVATLKDLFSGLSSTYQQSFMVPQIDR